MSRRRRTPGRRAPVGWQKAQSLSLTEAADVLGISRTRAYAWAADGRIPTTPDHLGEHRVKPADLKRLLGPKPKQQALFPAPGVQAFSAEWLAAVEADPALKDDPEAVAVARWLADHADDQGNLDAEASAALHALGVK